MTGREFSFSYNGTPVIDHLRKCAPVPRDPLGTEPFYVYVMGPYTAFDATYPFPDADALDSPFIEDPLFDPDEHLDKLGRHTYEAALADLCEAIRAELGVIENLSKECNEPRFEPVMERRVGEFVTVGHLDVAFEKRLKSAV